MPPPPAQYINCSKEDCHLCYYFKMYSNISVGDPAFRYSCSISQYHNSKASNNSGLKTVEKTRQSVVNRISEVMEIFFLNEWVYMNTKQRMKVNNNQKKISILS